jgi:hypothetical protein
MVFLKWCYKRIVLILIIICLYIVFGYTLGANAWMKQALTQEDTKKMKEHIEKVKFKNPAKYQAMIKKTGGNITDCCSCHTEVCSISIPGSTIIAPPAEQRIPRSLKKK